jgi:branched-chain amino acid transport system ATP-binding protein
MLEVRDLDVKYGAATAVRRVSLDVAAGELVCVVGPNGAGKSTLINAIAGLHRAASGTMSFDGCDLTRLAPHRFCATGIAIVPEGRRLFTGMTVRENLMLGSYAPTLRAARSASLQRVCALFPVLSEKLDAQAGALSGGQQQMVAIARALLNENRILLVDEPTKGLAPLLVVEVANALERICEKSTVLLVEQNLAVVRRVAQHVVVLDTGRVVHSGDALELLDDTTRVHALLGVA